MCTFIVDVSAGGAEQETSTRQVEVQWMMFNQPAKER